MPTWVVFPVPVHRNIARSFKELLNLPQTLLKFILIPDDSNKVLHFLLQLVLDLKRVFLAGGRGCAIERIESDSGGMLHLVFIDRAFPILFGELRRELAGAFCVAGVRDLLCLCVIPS